MISLSVYDTHLLQPLGDTADDEGLQGLACFHFVQAVKIELGLRQHVFKSCISRDRRRLVLIDGLFY